ncbi:MAG TPA: hypothetical protein PLW02_04080, partial [Verrucomicrobiota bacterium]|nr:hypothetical protein [Verrucomicrobiota bacterium]
MALKPTISALFLIACTTALIGGENVTTVFSKKEKLAITSVKLSDVKIPLYKRVEITVDLNATYDNPFN